MSSARCVSSSLRKTMPLVPTFAILIAPAPKSDEELVPQDPLAAMLRDVPQHLLIAELRSRTVEEAVQPFEELRTLSSSEELRTLSSRTLSSLEELRTLSAIEEARQKLKVDASSGCLRCRCGRNPEGNFPEAEPPKKRKAGHWPGWKVKRQGSWPGFELINTGGHMELMQASIGSELWTFYVGKFYQMKVENKKGCFQTIGRRSLPRLTRTTTWMDLRSSPRFRPQAKTLLSLVDLGKSGPAYFVRRSLCWRV